MYIKPSGARQVSVPQNYGGNLFSPSKEEPKEEKTIEGEASDESIPVASQPKNSLQSLFENEDLIILGLILLLSQDGFGDDILPILLLILLFKK